MRFQHNGFFSPVTFVICILLLLGGMAGKWAGDSFRLRDRQVGMDAYMHALAAHADRIAVSARKALVQANRSPFEKCSREDKVYLRELIFSGYHIKDIGRLGDDRLLCSTLLSDISDEPRRSAEDVRLRDGTYIYRDRNLITPGSHGPVIGNGDANIVLSAVAFDAMKTRKYAFAIFMANEDRTQFARLYGFPDGYLQGQNLATLFAKREHVAAASSNGLQEQSCDAATGICISLATSPESGNPSGQLLPILFTSLGMLGGGGVVMAWLYYRSRNRSLNSMLKKALAAKKLALVYQPIVTVSDGRTVGFEALIRWEITKGEFIPPDIFIARAETIGLADKITIYVLDRVIEEMGELLRQKRALRININMTASNLQNPGFMDALRQRLDASDIEPQQIGLELTERTAVDFARATAGIRQLRERGHRIYIDDFGTGYSNLAYLGELHVDAIKIDKVFTRTVGNEGEAVSIVPQIVSMAQEHGLDIVVEGIETPAQLEYLRGLCGGLSGQGWLFGRPMDANAAQALVGAVAQRKRRRRSVKPGGKQN
ncbi:EAL domain-containing protein [Falsochrobactrum sp. TDYN1]|uniref:EAL domain-containing protein n=1 Tax=Falsochrobactrum tianjinense TaxID=2706015 RepID=A0A949PKF9_9HYPH|nr:EAL domain-containing protein [Falsochrobactrum sp. TDYN1]MBV2142583.1 EAL domain-containing protein [Falsochrobactrum sp. TDYN1]